MFEYLKNRFIKSILNFNLIIFNYFMIIRNFIFSYVDKIYFIYYLPDDNIESKVTNITFNYYTGFGISRYNKGIYYFIINHKNGTEHVAYKGLISDIQKFKQIENVTKRRRKNILLLDKDIPLKKDLNIFDNYMINCENYKDTYIYDLKTVVKLFGLKCTHVSITQLFPNFYHETFDIDTVNVNDLFI